MHAPVHANAFRTPHSPQPAPEAAGESASASPRSPAPVIALDLAEQDQRTILPEGRDAIMIPLSAGTLSAFPGIAPTAAGLGTVLFVPAGTCISAGFEAGFENGSGACLLLLLDPQLRALVGEALGPCAAQMPDTAFLMHGAHPVRALVPLVRRFGAAIAEPGAAFALRALAELLLHEIALGHSAARSDARRTGRPARGLRLQPHHLAAIDRYIERNIENVLRIDDLAAQVGLSRYHFLRCFKRATGSSPLQYVLARRAEHARELLARSEESIAAVAYAAGFSSQSHLNAMFKRHFGVTPGAFVRVHRRPAGTPEPVPALP
ncbi:MAG: AraC family transcriptional regulator [Erythrobacter sp.]|uniref:helix-turn-helix transcriptional regulator n=1 Tax=Erythrobacter sp. TaxID=1042 RepID=UPI0025F5E1F2|nr:AraC family transcriptional regulator [Erythrobacter sp.]MCM0000124.1 AraC family transcriptional regulator [Erythrobacter sp.]